MRLECSSKEAGARVTWYKDGTALDISSGKVLSGGALVFQAAGVGDLGLYTCEVISVGGRSQTASAYLDVKCKDPMSMPYFIFRLSNLGELVQMDFVRNS